MRLHRLSAATPSFSLMQAVSATCSWRAFAGYLNLKRYLDMIIYQIIYLFINLFLLRRLWKTAAKYFLFSSLFCRVFLEEYIFLHASEKRAYSSRDKKGLSLENTGFNEN